MKAVAVNLSSWSASFVDKNINEMIVEFLISISTKRFWFALCSCCHHDSLTLRFAVYYGLAPGTFYFSHIF